jgi:SulP family sulfate permease
VLLLFHPKEVFVLWKMNRHDGVVAVTVFVLALLMKPDYALIIGVAISIILYLWKTMHPRIVRITKDPEYSAFINADRYKKPSCPQILQLRSDNPIFFANAEYTVSTILDQLDAHTTPIKYLLLDFQSVGFIDMTGVDELRMLQEEVEERSIQLAIMGVRLPVKKVLESSGLMRSLNNGHLIKNRGNAIRYLIKNVDHTYCKDVCSHKLFYECSNIK